MANRILEKFRRGEKSLGIFTHMLSATAIEAMAYTGLDYAIIDIEHSPIAAEHAAELVGVAERSGLSALVRVDAIERSPILKMLDVGASGLIVPQVESVEQVRTLVSYAKFAPLGSRGYCQTRDGGWGLAENYAGGHGRLHGARQRGDPAHSPVRDRRLPGAHRGYRGRGGRGRHLHRPLRPLHRPGHPRRVRRRAAHSRRGAGAHGLREGRQALHNVSAATERPPRATSPRASPASTAGMDVNVLQSGLRELAGAAFA